MVPLIVEAGLRSGLLCAALWLASKAVMPRNPHVEKTACTLALAASLAMPILMQGVSIAVPTGGLLGAPAGIAVAPVAPFAAFAATPLAGPQAAWGTAARTFTWGAGLAGLYVAVVGVLLVRLGVGLALTWRLWFRARPIKRPGARVRVSLALDAPVTVGGTVLLPADSARWPALMLRAVLLHEGAHVRNLDFHVQLLASVNCALFWFNPAAWWLKHRLADLAETTSDIATIEGLDGDRARYAEVLLEVARRAGGRVGVAMARPARLVGRIERILGEAVLPRRLGWRAGLALATGMLPLVLLAAGGTLSPARAAAPTVVEAQTGMMARQVAPFDKVEVSGPWTLDLTVGQAQSVEVGADQGALAHVITEVRDGTLRVSLDRNWDDFLHGNPHLVVRIAMPRLTGLQTHGSGTANVSGLDGGASVFTFDGSWKINARGRLDTYKLLIHGSGKAAFDALAAGDVSLTVDGSGQAQVRAERTLDVVIHGSGKVRYAGSPAIRQTIHGSGSLVAM